MKVKNPRREKVINVLELMAVLILLSDFGQVNFYKDNLIHNSELVEHKINLLLILFDLRSTNKMNVVEIMIMARNVF